MDNRLRVFAAVAAAALLAATQPAPEDDPAIVAPSPTAQFSASSGRLTFDRACGRLTFETLASDPTCAERVGRGETGPTIEVVAGTISTAHTPANIRTGLAMLDRAIAAEGHPAAYYLAASLVGTGEVETPDYPRAVAYLERAAIGGNAAAADLLAVFLLEGRGTAKDVGRAVRLLEQAAAGGMESSATRLAFVHLNGRDVPADPERARRILERAAAVGVRGAAQVLAMLAADGTVHNYQLHPSEDPTRVEVREYRTFNNPAIPPAFGFTDDFQRLHYSAYSDPEVLARLEREQASLPTPFLYELARRTVPVSPDRALGYYLLAKIRMTYDARRCADPQAMEAVAAWDRIALPDVRHALRGLTAERLAAAVAFALEREAALPADTRPWWVCYAGLASFSLYTEGEPLPLRLVAEGEWPRLRREIREQLAGARLPGSAPSSGEP